MKAINTIDRKTVNMLADEVKAALAVVAKKYGMELQPGSGKFSPTEFTPKFTLKVAQSAPAVKAKASTEAEILGLPKDSLGKTVTIKKTNYEITGFNLRAPKFAVVLKRVRDGKTFRAPVGSVLPSLVK